MAPTDGSLAILREYEAKHPNLRVFSHQKNAGHSAAHNTGIEQIRGDFCLFLDCDDFLADGCFQKAKDLLSGKGDDTMLCVGRFHFEEKGVPRQDCVKNGSYFGCPTRSWITNRFIPARLSRQFRFLENACYGENEVFSLELALLDPKILTLEEPIYFYRKYGDQTMALSAQKKHLKHADSVIHEAIYVRKNTD